MLDTKNIDHLNKLLPDQQTAGLVTLISMLQEVNQQDSVNQLVQYLIRGWGEHQLPETFLTFACLYLYFAGKCQNL